MGKRIGFVVSHEADFAEALVDRLRAVPAIDAELVTIGGVTERPLSRWDVIVDGASERVPHYRAWLRAMALAGAMIVDDPFSPAAEDRYFSLAVTCRAGVRVPRSILLPQHSYGPDVDHARGLRNLEDPWRWSDFAHYVKLPALLRDTRAGLERAVIVDDLDHLWRAFDETGERICALQALVEGQPFLRGIAVGQDEVVLLEGSPEGPHHLLKDEGVSLATRARAQEAVRRTREALDLEIAVVDLAVVEGEVWVIDVGSGVRGLTSARLGGAFERVVEATAAALVRVARSGTTTIARHPVGRRLGS